MKKYCLDLYDRKKNLDWNGNIYRTFYRVVALKDFSDVKAGDKGGYIEKEENLSQWGKCWVYDNALVCDDAIVKGNAKIKNNAKITTVATISENAVILDNVEIGGITKIKGNSVILGNTKIKITEEVKITGHTIIKDNIVC